MKEISKEASTIKDLLDKNKIKYCLEYSFEDLKGRKKVPYRFDFAILDENNSPICLIEYDSKIHFNKNSSFYKDSGEFKRAQERDRKKNNYCLSRGIRLVRIPYWELKGLTLEKILSSQKFVVKSMWHNDLLITKK